MLPPIRLHHYAFVVRDQEANRRFFEDVLGVPLVATWCEHAQLPGQPGPVSYCHTFFGLADGSALAFFQFADPRMYERTAPVDTSAVTRFRHIALKVDRAAFDDIERRLSAASVPHYVTDHGYCESLYTTSPDGLRVEFTVDPDDIDAILALRKADAHSELSRWLAGNHRPNNEIRRPTS